MKIKNLFLSLFLGIGLLLVPVMVQATTVDYEDETQVKEAMDYLWVNEIIHGYPDGTYRLGNQINRAEFTKMMILAIGENGAGKNCFSDVKDEWFAGYVCKAKEMGIIDGHPDGTFRPADSVSFVEAAKIVVNGFDKKKICLDCEGAQWYKTFVNSLESGNAIPDAVTSFDQKLTRGELFEMMWRVKTEVFWRPYTTFDIIENRVEALRYVNGAWLEIGGNRIFPPVALFNDDEKIVLKTIDKEIEVEDADWSSFEYVGNFWNHVLLFRDDSRLYVLDGNEVQKNENITPYNWVMSGYSNGAIVSLNNASGPIDGDAFISRTGTDIPSSSEYVIKENLYYDLYNKELWINQYEKFVGSPGVLDDIFKGVEDTAELRQEQLRAGMPSIADVKVLFDDRSDFFVDKSGIYQTKNSGVNERVGRFTGIASLKPVQSDDYKIIIDSESVFFFSQAVDGSYPISFHVLHLKEADPDSFRITTNWYPYGLAGQDDKNSYLFYGDNYYSFELDENGEAPGFIKIEEGVFVFSHDGKVKYVSNGKVSVLENADWESFDYVEGYVRDKDSLWLYDKANNKFKETDITGGKFINDLVFTNDGKVYQIDGVLQEVRVIEGADGETFVETDTDTLFKDKDSVFYKFTESVNDDDGYWYYPIYIKKIEGLSAANLEVFFSRDYGRTIFGDDDQMFLMRSPWIDGSKRLTEIKDINVSGFRMYSNPYMTKEKMSKGWGREDVLAFTDGVKVWVSDPANDESELRVISGVTPDSFSLESYFDQYFQEINQF